MVVGVEDEVLLRFCELVGEGLGSEGGACTPSAMTGSDFFCHGLNREILRGCGGCDWDAELELFCGDG